MRQVVQIKREAKNKKIAQLSQRESQDVHIKREAKNKKIKSLLLCRINVLNITETSRQNGSPAASEIILIEHMLYVKLQMNDSQKLGVRISLTESNDKHTKGEVKDKKINS